MRVKQRYGQSFGNDAVCRAILLSALGEPNAPSPEQTQRQHGDETTKIRDVGKHGQTAVRLVYDALTAGEQVTQAMVVKSWRATKNVPEYVEANPPKDLNAFECEQIIVSLLLEHILEFHVHWTAYQAVAYLRLGQRGVALMQSHNPRMMVRFALLPTNTTTKTTTPKKTTNPSSEWLSNIKTKKTAPKKSKKKPAAKKPAKKPVAKKPAAKKKKTTRSVKNEDVEASVIPHPTAAFEVIELSSDDNHDDDDEKEEP